MTYIPLLFSPACLTRADIIAVRVLSREINLFLLLFKGGGTGRRRRRRINDEYRKAFMTGVPEIREEQEATAKTKRAKSNESQPRGCRGQASWANQAS